MKPMKAGLTALSAWAVLTAVLSGQAVSGRIVGTIRDEENRKLAGVQVTLVNANNNSRRTTCSGKEDGMFRMLGLQPGYYQLEFELAGYEPYTLGGIALSVEQSVTLSVKLKKAAARGISESAASGSFMPEQTASAPDGPAGPPPASGLPEEDDQPARTNFFAERQRWAIHFSLSANYLAGGDSNAYLRAFPDRVGDRITDSFETMHSGSDLSVEVGFRATPRLEFALGAGLVRARKRNNDLSCFRPGTYQNRPTYFKEQYMIDLQAKTFPVQLICRYWLASKGSRIYSVYAAILFHFASWSMSTYHQPRMNFYQPYESIELETASRQGLGLAAGGRIEWRLDDHLSFSVDLGGRYAPLRYFSGERTYYGNGNTQAPQVSRGHLWFFEFSDPASHKWVKELGIGDRPAGEGIRNVSSATVDFSGLALRLGFLFRI